MNYWIILLSMFMILNSASCKKEMDCTDCVGGNKIPKANAGIDINIYVPADTALLDGSASVDEDGRIVSYTWTKISGNEVNIISPDSAKTMVKNLRAGVYKFQLQVKDNGGLSSKDTMILTMTDLSQPNNTPVADAGADQVITAPIQAVNVSGIGSTDQDNNIVSYSWSKISGPASCLIVHPNEVQTEIKNLVPGDYSFELKVKDATALEGKDTIQVSVLYEAASSCVNRPEVIATLVPFGQLSSARYGVKGAAAGNKLVFAAGAVQGAHSSAVDIFDFNTQSWSVASLTIPERDGMAVTVLGSKIFFAGGGNNDWVDVTSRIDIYDAASNSWTTAELSKPRQYLAATTLGNKIFFAGGGNWEQPIFTGSTTVDIYDQVSNSWSVAHLSQGRYELTATTINNKIYFAGGLTDMYSGTKKIDIYDGVTGSWTTTELHDVKAGHAAIAVGSEIFWASGATTSYQQGYLVTSQAEIRDVVSGTTRFACMLSKAQFEAVRKDDKIVFFTTTISNGAAGNRFDIYHIPTRSWSTGILPFDIKGAAVVAVNNSIYIAGGSVNGVYSNQVWKLVF